MKSSLTTDLGLLLLRIVPSAMMLTHGYPKFQKLLSGDFEFADPIGLGVAPSLFLTVIAEFICPVLIIVGFKTRWAALPPAIAMFVATFIVHISDALGRKELAIMYLGFFAIIMLLGPGKYSADRK
ncbi:DoxX family protein [Sediminicola arcticus]|jgi:putative oxidoreductase|uniref:DoxX family protein n=1 Tax=Sediminicola arcticus TaxID=1574308 RepID=A0ABV2SU85_9FLAO